MKSTRPSRVTRVIAVASMAMLTFSACTSDPSPHRVAEDLINSLATSDAERDCMLEILDGYSNSDLEKWGNDVETGDLAAQEAAQAELDAFQADLETCNG